MYADYQDQQEASNKTVEEIIEDTVIEFLAAYYSDAINEQNVNDTFREDAQDFIQQLANKGFEITLKRKEASNENQKG